MSHDMIRFLQVAISLVIADGVGSLQSVSLSTATLDSCRTTTTAITNTCSTITNDHDTTTTFSCETHSDTGLLLHSKATCIGCFSLCQRQEIAQPTDQVRTVTCVFSDLCKEPLRGVKLVMHDSGH